jgi:hypothetical protein
MVRNRVAKPEASGTALPKIQGDGNEILRFYHAVSVMFLSAHVRRAAFPIRRHGLRQCLSWELVEPHLPQFKLQIFHLQAVHGDFFLRQRG